MKFFVLFALALSSILHAPAASAQAIQAVRLAPDERIRLDGVLDDDVWSRAPAATEFRQQEPFEGGAPTEQTEVRVAFDEDNLYLGVLLRDSDPDGILAYQRARNASLATDDRFMWILDTFQDGRSGYFFEINPAGLMGDGIFRASGGMNKSWDGIWEARVARGDYGWSAEIRIPFRTLNFNPDLTAWGINFQRTIRRKQEELVWSGYRRNQGLWRPANAGRLIGLEGISQGRGLEVKPYAVASARDGETPGSGWTTPTDIGFDLNYSVTPNLRGSLSVNTDFAEVEVDQRRVNLSRFPLRFPEQRDFFLEGSSIFDFAPANGVEPYFSRRIGLIGGAPVPVRFGGRLTGQAGAYDVGFVQVRTGAEGGEPAEQFTVARVTRNFLDQSNVGVLYTRRAPGEPGAVDRHTIGTDLNLFTSRFAGNRNLQFQAFHVWHNDPRLGPEASTVDRSAFGVRLTYPNDIWSGHVSYRQLGESFDPAVGFTPRRGFRRLQPTITYAPRPSWLPQVRELVFDVRAEYLMNMENELATGGLDLGLLGVLFESGDAISLDRTDSFERLENPFRVHPDTTLEAVIPAGEFRTSGWRLSGNTAGRRPVSANMSISRGGFWTGDRDLYSAGVTVRPAAGVAISSQFERNDVRLPEADFQTNLVRLNSSWHASPWTTLSGSVQYDNLSDVVGLYTRFRWIARPGSDVYLVYTHNWNYLDGTMETLQRGGATKISYTHRF